MLCLIKWNLTKESRKMNAEKQNTEKLKRGKNEFGKIKLNLGKNKTDFIGP